VIQLAQLGAADSAARQNDILLIELIITFWFYTLD